MGQICLIVLPDPLRCLAQSDLVTAPQRVLSVAGGLRTHGGGRYNLRAELGRRAPESSQPTYLHSTTWLLLAHHLL